MKISEILTPDVETVSPNDDLVTAADLMRDLDVGSVPVCAGDKLVGMLTDRDIVVRAVALSLDPEDTEVQEIMSPDPVAVFVDQEAQDAARIMKENKIRRLPVLNRDNQLVGIIALGDLAVDLNAADLSGKVLQEVSDPASPAR